MKTVPDSRIPRLERQNAKPRAKRYDTFFSRVKAERVPFNCQKQRKGTKITLAKVWDE